MNRRNTVYRRPNTETLQSELSTAEATESAQQAQADLQVEDPVDGESAIADLLKQDEE